MSQVRTISSALVHADIPASLKESLDKTKVDYVRLGSSGLHVSVPILGGMSLGSSKWQPWVLDEEPSIEILGAAYERGVNTWDTANMYSNGISEEVIGKAIQRFNIPREKLVLMTKCFMYVSDEPSTPPFAMLQHAARTKDYVGTGGLSRSAIFKAVDASLARLGTSYIDLFQIHRFDPETPIEETMKALHDLVQAGKVHYIGASSMWATQFAQMQFTAEKNGWTKFISMQNYYNLCYREEEREMIRFCKETGVGIIPWSPMFTGRLARPVGSQTSTRSKLPVTHDNGLTPADEEIIRRVEKIATDKGWTMSQVALTWLTGNEAIPIVGFNSISRIDDACGLRGKSLTDEERKQLEEPYVPKLIAGHW